MLNRGRVSANFNIPCNVFGRWFSTLLVFVNVEQCMEYFVTGATGLIGSHLVHELVDNGDEVIALTPLARTRRTSPTA